MNESDESVVAERTYWARQRAGSGNGENESLKIRIFRPQRQVDAADAAGWTCQLSASGVINAQQTVEGRDSFQALEAACALVMSWAISASGKYELCPAYEDSDRSDFAVPDAFTLMHGLVLPTVQALTSQPKT